MTDVRIIDVLLYNFFSFDIIKAYRGRIGKAPFILALVTR